MKPALQLRQSQQLLLTPQLQQAIKLLQLSTLEINQETARLLDENPFLEREDDNGNQTYSGSSSSEPVSSNSSNDNPAPKPNLAPVRLIGQSLLSHQVLLAPTMRMKVMARWRPTDPVCANTCCGN